VLRKSHDQNCARFWSKVNRDGPVPAHVPELGRCWSWTGLLNKRGYGRFTIGSHPGKQYLAHRYAYEITTGDFDPALRVLHRCDNPACVRPSHLFSGDDAANHADAKAKGRLPHGDGHYMRDPSRVRKGERCGASKLTAHDVAAIRSAISEGSATKSELAARHGVTFGCVHLIATRKNWSHLP
jgi:hypothetical protein